MKAHTTTSGASGTASRRSLVARTAAVAFGALSIAGIALVGVGASASAAPATTAVQQQTARDLRSFCLSIEGVRGDDDQGCGRSVTVEIDEPIRTVGFAARRTAICVEVQGLFGAEDSDCSRRGGSVEASVRGVAASVRLWAEDTRLCGRASSDGRWDRRISCSGWRGWLELEGRRGIDGLQVWVR